MYFPIGWPKLVNLALPGESAHIHHVCCDALKIIVAAVSDDFLGIWYANPLLPITYYKRSNESLEQHGLNKLIVWKPDSRQIVVLTTAGVLLLYQIDFDAQGINVLTQIDSPHNSLRRDSAELFIKENIPRLNLRELCSFNVGNRITTICCISLTELLIATDKCELVRLQWSELELQNDASKLEKTTTRTDANQDITTSQLSSNNNNNNVNATFTPGVIINLRRIHFYVNQSCHLKNCPPIADAAYVASLEYSPFIGGCAAVFSDNRAAFLMAMHLVFHENNLHGFWVPEVEDATVCNVNHKFRLLAYGRKNSDVSVFAIEDTTGGLEFSHRLSLNSNVMPGSLGMVCELKWSPDGCVLAVAWQNGGIALWSTFGALLMSSFSWDFGLHVDLMLHNPLQIKRLEWSTEGYQLFMTCQPNKNNHKNNNNNSNNNNDEYNKTNQNNNSNKNDNKNDAKNNTKTTTITTSVTSNTLILNFVKSTLTMNPCMTSHPYVLLQGDDTIYLNQGDNLEKIYPGANCSFPNDNQHNPEQQPQQTSAATSDTKISTEDTLEVKNMVDMSSILSESKYWCVLQLPQTYAATNWPIRYSAIDATGTHVAVAGRTGLAHYSLLTKKWKLFGNESQEKDFVVSGGLLWWQGFIIMGCFSLIDRTDEIRCYPDECKLDNQFGNKFQVRAPVMSMNMFNEQLIALTADGIISLFALNKLSSHVISVDWNYEIDVKNICIHPACIVSLTVCNLRNDVTHKLSGSNINSSSGNIGTSCNTTPHATPHNNGNSSGETIIVNVCGRILMIQRDLRNSVVNSLMASCLASCVECFWLSNAQARSPMADCLWLYSGAHGMRVWLPILPPSNEQHRDTNERLHTFMSKRIMLSFLLKLYPLVILFDNVIVLGVENETTLYTSEANTHFSLPFCVLERKSQVYLHRILRQLIKRNLGYSAWEIAKCCRFLPYFPHALELLLHEVLEEEATSKEPIPDALLPSILDFIREFPVYLQTIVQCARKTEIALWPYLFSMAGKPKDLFQQCLLSEELETAASYLIILQNLEPSIISKQYAILLLDIALQNRKWDLAKDLIRFLKAIDPNEIDSPRSSMVVNMKIAPPTQSQVNQQNPEVFNLILGTIARERSFSTTQATTPLNNMSSSVSSVTNDVTNTTNNNPSSGGVNAVGTSGSVSGGSGSASVVMRRKSERSNSTRERREIFCIESILQRHARKMLQHYKLIDLGYMSASLDFHLVSWLSQEADRAAKLDDFVLALMALHEELQLPLPCAKNNANANGNADNCEVDANELNALTLDYAQLQRQFLESRASQLHQASSQTSESGYFSLAVMDTPTSMQNGSITAQGIASIKECDELGLLTRSLSLNDDNDNNSNDNDTLILKSRSNSQMSIDNSNHNNNLVQLPQVTSLHVEFGGTENQHVLPDKLAIQMRYLLQLFIEAKCTDYALVLSILLQDAASIGRIINMVIRSESLSTCTRIENTLKRLTLWSFDRECLYRSFMIALQPYIYLLEQYVASNEKSNPSNLMTSGSTSGNMPNGIALANGSIVNKLDSVDGHGIDGIMHDNQQTADHHYQKKLSNGKINWPMKTQRQSSVDGIASPPAKNSLMGNARRASTGEHEKRSQGSGCSMM